MRTADNRVSTLLALYESGLADRYAAGERKAIVRAVFRERLGWDAAQLALKRGDALSESELLQVYDPLKRLMTGEPLQYVLGHVHFHGLVLEVGPGVLIPRPETEELVQRIVDEGEAARFIVDVGTGSGCMALALEQAYPEARVLGIDISPEALFIARRNGQRNGSKVEWVEADVRGDGFAWPAGIDLVVSNPPYVPLSEADTLTSGVLDHEPHLALFVADEDPLQFYGRIAELAWHALRPGGRLFFEGHHRSAPAVGALLHGRGYKDVRVGTDLSGNPRFIRAQR